MPLGFTQSTWNEALQDFVYHLQATKADKTIRFYQTQLRQIITWAEQENIPFDRFGKRHLDRYLAMRSSTVSRATMRHDAIAAKAFFRWCAKNDILERSLLAEYEIHAAPTPAKYMPTDADMQALLRAVGDYWNPLKNPGMKNVPPTRRLMHRERNYALLLMLLDTAARIGEILNLTLEDYRASERQIVIRERKGREPRTLPLSPGAIKALASWLRVRDRMLADTPSDQAEQWLFLRACYEQWS